MLNGGAMGWALGVVGAICLLVLVPACGVEGSSTSGDRPGREPYCAQLHIHQSMSEGEASFLGNVEAARQGGVIDVIWFTDHDWRMAMHSYVGKFGFERGIGPETTVIPRRVIKPGPPEDEAIAGWWPGAHGRGTDPAEMETTPKELPPGLVSASASRVTEPVSQGGGALRLQARAAVGSTTYSAHELQFKAFGFRAIRPLAAGIKVHLSIYPMMDAGADTRIRVRFVLSEQPPDLRAELNYWLADRLPAGSEPRRQKKISDHLLEFTPGEWNHLTFDLTGDAMSDGLGGIDNAMTELRISVEARNGAEVTAVFDDLRIEQDLTGEEVMAAARGLARDLSGGGLTLHVGQEISYGAHLNALGPDIPLFDLQRYEHGLVGSETAAFIHDHGGVAILDHMYGVGRVIEEITGDHQAERRLVERTVGSLLAVNAYGADALEVGYPLRGGMTLDHHLEAWDAVGKEGVVITGVGTADTHSNRRTWKTGRPNNWTTWIWSASPAMEDLMAGIREGACYFGDPALWDGRMDLYTATGRRMGDVVIAAGPRQDITFVVDGLKPGWEARLIRNGTVFESISIAADKMKVTRQIPTGDTAVVRFCVHDQDGEAVVCSNPLYFYPLKPERLLPVERLAADGLR
jgi:hypothetical protein